jgi:hypothetical protein
LNTTQTLRLAGPKTRIAPVVGSGILAVVLVIGALAVTRQAPGQPNTLPAAAAPTFDAVKFRAEEHAALAPQVPFDWVRFRAEEREAMYPLAPYGDSLYRAQQRTATKQAPSTSGGGSRSIHAK